MNNQIDVSDPIDTLLKVGIHNVTMYPSRVDYYLELRVPGSQFLNALPSKYRRGGTDIEARLSYPKWGHWWRCRTDFSYRDEWWGYVLTDNVYNPKDRDALLTVDGDSRVSPDELVSPFEELEKLFSSMKQVKRYRL